MAADALDGEPTVELQVRVADAQGLRLKRGGQIRLVITLRASDDPQGVTFGAKVTPWLAVPDGEAPQWRAREAVFVVQADRCFQAEFVDSAHLHMELLQKGHAKPPETPAKAPVAARGLGWSSLNNLTNNGLTAALRQGTAAIPIAWPKGTTGADNAPDRGELIGVLQLPVGKSLVCPGGIAAGDADKASWVSLVEASSGRGPDAKSVRGRLLLELATAHRGLGPGLISLPAPLADLNGAGFQAPTVHGSKATPPVSTGASSPRPSNSEMSDSASDVGADAASDTASLSRFSTSSVRGDEEVERFVPPPLPPDLLSSKAVAELLAAGAARASERGPPQTWRPVGAAARTPGESFDPGGSHVNIFTINNPASSSSSPDGGSGGGMEETVQSLRNMLRRWTTVPSVPSAGPLKQRLRSAFDPEIRQQRKEVRKWRRWHEVFCVLNEIERRLGEAMALLVQAAASMRRFGVSHGTVQESPHLPAFLRDAALYYRSEGEVPRRLEVHLGELEHIADKFRSVTMKSGAEPNQVDDSQAELRRACEDLQLDMAVLLESALMAAHQALAEYKKMHCRLQLVATEYEPLCRLELDDAARPVSFLPLLADESTKAAAAALPQQAVQWALDFSQLVGSASQGLEARVRELELRRRRLSSCSSELRATLLRRAASGDVAGDGGGR